jgi:putative membrane protein (TIGR04086 family)
MRGTLEAFLVSLILFALASLVIAYTPVSDQLIPLLAAGTGIISILWGGRKAAKLAGKGVLVNGALVGVVYGLIALFLGAIILTEPISSGALMRAAAAVGIGAIGGMLAPKKRSYRRR